MKHRRAPPSPDPWTPDELAEHLAKVCGTQFRTGPVEPDDPKKRPGTHKFRVMLPSANEVGATMAVVRISPTLEVRVDMASPDPKMRKTITVLRESLEQLAKPATRR